MTLFRPITWTAVTICAFATTASRADDIVFKTGTLFRRELGKPISINRDDAELRPLLHRLRADREVAILLDRRVDPSLRFDVHVQTVRFRTALEDIAERAGIGVTIVGSTVYFGPTEAAEPLRTIIALRENELDQFSERLGRREFELTRMSTLRWPDLARPVDLVRRTADRISLSVDLIDQIPHDLWAGAEMAAVTPIEALSLLLIQFDLTFEWTGPATGIRLVPLPRRIVITRSHAVVGLEMDEALERIRDRFPDVTIELDTREFQADATIEQHEEIAILARGGNPDEMEEGEVDFGPLSRRRFTFKVLRQPAGAVLKTLEVNGLDLAYDLERLRAAGVDFNRKISFDLKQATADELFTEICEPLGLEYEIDGDRITLRPATEQ